MDIDTRFPRVTRGITLCALAAAFALTGCAVPVERTAWVESAPRAVHVAYGTVERIADERQELEPTGGGAALGAIVGGVLGNRFGEGFGRALATGAGAIGGAVVGNQIERNEAAAGSSQVYRVTVRMDDGSRRTVDFQALDGLRVGERVHFQNGQLIRG